VYLTGTQNKDDKVSNHLHFWQKSIPFSANPPYQINFYLGATKAS